VPAEFNASYKPKGTVYHATPGTLDHWLTERYCLYGSKKPDEIVYGEIHHPSWSLQPAEMEIRVNTMTQPIGIELPDSKPISHFARQQEMVSWPTFITKIYGIIGHNSHCWSTLFDLLAI